MRQEPLIRTWPCDGVVYDTYSTGTEAASEVTLDGNIFALGASVGYKYSVMCRGDDEWVHAVSVTGPHSHRGET